MTLFDLHTTSISSASTLADELLISQAISWVTSLPNLRKCRSLYTAALGHIATVFIPLSAPSAAKHARSVYPFNSESTAPANSSNPTLTNTSYARNLRARIEKLNPRPSIPFQAVQSFTSVPENIVPTGDETALSSPWSLAPNSPSKTIVCSNPFISPASHPNIYRPRNRTALRPLLFQGTKSTFPTRQNTAKAWILQGHGTRFGTGMICCIIASSFFQATVSVTAFNAR